MKIVSKFKDYYDGIVHTFGIDKDIVYVREPTTLSDIRFKTMYLPTNKNYWRHDRYWFTIIGVAGKLYPLLILDKLHKYKEAWKSDEYKTFYIYDEKEIREYFYKVFQSQYERKHNIFENYMAQMNDKDVEQLFHDHKVGAFILKIVDPESIWRKQVLNLELEPILKDIDFAKVVDPVTMFQNMQTFISEQLCTEIDNHPATDKEKIVSKGFDYVTSFRKEKGGKKRRKNK